MALDPIGVIFTAKDLASGSIGRLDKRFKTLDRTTDQTAARFSKNLKLMGAGLVAVGVGAVGLGVLNAAGKRFASLGTTVAEVGTLIKGTPEEIDMLTTSSIALANTFGGDARAQAAAFYQAISAGVGGVTQAQDFLIIANKVAIGGVTDAATAIDGLTTITNAFTADSVTGQQAADGLFVAMKAGKTTIGELSVGISKAAAAAAALGITFDELLGSTAALTSGGTPTTVAFTNLKAVFTAFASKQEIAKQLGKETAAAFSLQNLKAKGLRRTLLEVSESVGGNIEKLTKLLGSSEAVNAVLSLTGAQATIFSKIMDDMENKTGAADGAFLKMTKTTEFIEARFDALTSGVVLLIGEAFDPIRKAVLSFGVSVLEVFNSIPKPIVAFTVKIFALVSAVIAVGGAILFFKAAFVVLSIIAAKVGLILLPIIGTVVAITVAIGLLVLMIRNNFGGIGDFFSNAFDNIKIFMAAIIGVLTKGEISQELFKQLEDAGILGFVETVLNGFFRVKAFLGGLFDGFVTGASIAMPAVQVMIDTFILGLSIVGDIMGDVAGGIVGLMGGANDAGGALMSMGNIGKTIGLVFGTVFGALASGFATIASVGGGLINLFLLFLKVIGIVGRKLGEVIGGAVEFFTNNKAINFVLKKVGLGPDEKEGQGPIIPIAPEGIASGGAGVLGPNGADIGIDNVGEVLNKQNESGIRNAGGLADAISRGGSVGNAAQELNLITRVMIDEVQIGEAVQRVNTKKRTANGGQN